MKHVLFLLIALIGVSVNAQELPETAETLMARAHLQYTIPTDFIQTDPIEYYLMNWEFSFKHPKKKFEVRYAIRPLDTAVKEYEEFQKNKKEGDILIDPNKVSKSLLMATIMNISNGGGMSGATNFDEAAVKSEFNADWGSAVMVETNETFGQGYKYCLAMMIHKDNVGDVFIFFMGNKPAVIRKEMESVFHNMVFLPE
jgi:hypothetical protein